MQGVLGIGRRDPGPLGDLPRTGHSRFVVYGVSRRREGTRCGWVEDVGSEGCGKVVASRLFVLIPERVREDLYRRERGVSARWSWSKSLTKSRGGREGEGQGQMG